jgi:hypothetical protein
MRRKALHAMLNPLLRQACSQVLRQACSQVRLLPALLQHPHLVGKVREITVGKVDQLSKTLESTCLVNLIGVCLYHMRTIFVALCMSAGACVFGSCLTRTTKYRCSPPIRKKAWTLNCWNYSCRSPVHGPPCCCLKCCHSLGMLIVKALHPSALQQDASSSCTGSAKGYPPGTGSTTSCGLARANDP